MLKKFVIPAASFALGMLSARSCSRPPMIGDKAPAFTANSTSGIIDFPSAYEGSWIVLFSHPADFSPVCTTEFMAFQAMQNEFKELNTELVGISNDDISSHLAWIKTIKDKIEFAGLSEVNIKFPIIDDQDMSIAKKYGMIHPKTSNVRSVRSLFVIDPQGIIRAVSYYPPTIGRNVKEVKRFVIALKTADNYGVFTPANWIPGEDVLVSPPESTVEAFERAGEKNELECYDWFLCFKNIPKYDIEEKLFFN